MLTFLKRWFGAAKQSDMAIFKTILVFGIVGLIASFALSVERLEQLINPNAKLLCNFNEIFNCGTVMQTWQAKVFGFPNSLIGLMAYPVVITLAVFGLVGVKFPRRLMLVAQICFGLGLVFAYWLFFQSLYVIEVLCPWCLLVTIATTILFEALLRYNLRHDNLYLSKRWHKRANGWLDRDQDKLATAIWLTLMVVLVLVKFPGIF